MFWGGRKEDVQLSGNLPLLLYSSTSFPREGLKRFVNNGRRFLTW